MKYTEHKDDLLKSALEFVKLLSTFECKRDLDPYWQIIFPLKGTQWAYLHISEYRQVYYVTEVINGASIEIDPVKKKVGKENNGSFSFREASYSNEKWNQLFITAIAWFKKVEKNWVSANKFVAEQFPLKYRKGIVPAAVVVNYFNEYKYVQKDTGIRNARKMVSVIEKGDLKGYDAGTVKTFTANDFFEYCKLAYKAVGLMKEETTGKDLYKRFADGRHEGLLDIDPASAEEFAAWIDGKHPQYHGGGHPWEILRGGNTSNVQLAVRRPMYGDKTTFKIEVRATGVSRLAESIKIFLEIYKAGKPIAINEPDTIREQLLFLDNIGIMPEYSSLHRGIQTYVESERVNSVIHLNHIKRHFSKIVPFITWEPLPILHTKFL